MWKKNRVKGFTLIELLIVTGILSLISLAIYASLSNGIKIWQKVNQSVVEEDLGIFLDNFTYDLRNTLKYGGIDFLGQEERIEFPTLINSQRLKMKTPGQITYAYPQGIALPVPLKEGAYNNVLSREEKDISQVFEGRQGRLRQVLKNIKSLRFRYSYYDREKKENIWQDECLGDLIPLAVRIELELKDGASSSKFVRTVSIPIGG